MDELKKIAYDCRLTVLDMVKESKAGHIGGSFSCMEILVALYHRMMKGEDKFILSKGHCAEALYAVLASRGFFEGDVLKSFAKFDTAFAEHPTRKIPGVEFATGALGHGLSVALGMGIALRADSKDAKVYVLMGDGELAEGSVWEAAMAAAKYRLDNVRAIVDRNGLQISGATEEIMPLADLASKFTAFNWEVRECDGHKIESLVEAMEPPSGKPLVIIANTVKGYGSELMEGRASWHHDIPTEEQYGKIKDSLISRRAAYV